MEFKKLNKIATLIMIKLNRHYENVCFPKQWVSLLRSFGKPIVYKIIDKTQGLETPCY